MKTVHFLTIILLFTLFSACRKEEKIADNARKMQDFVVAISQYIKGINPNFTIIPQNGCELAFVDANSSNNFHLPYLCAIDGMGVEELFYDGNKKIDPYRVNMLQKIREKNVLQKIMIADYINNNSYWGDAVQLAENEGFIAFPRSPDNYNYMHIPTQISHENANNIHTLSDAQNYLYLISIDMFSSKNDLLSAVENTNFDLLIIDMFFDEASFTASEVERLKTKKNGGKRFVASYINIGAAENWRYYWQTDWKKGNPSWLKKSYSGYKDEIWVEYWNPAWQSIIYGNDNSYIKKIIDLGFDGAYLDNVDAYYSLEKN